MDAATHWETIYRTRTADAVSWYQPEATRSLALIREVAPAPDAAILDVGGGASTLIDGLLAAGYRSIAVLDLAPAALATAQARLGPERSGAVTWLAGDVCAVALPAHQLDVWHDRAVFHFLTAPEARAQYVAQVRAAVRPGGHVIVATFAADGPTRCSGLEVARYAPAALHAEFGDDFALVRSVREEHRTPSGAVQAFTYCVCEYRPGAAVPPVTVRPGEALENADA